MSRRVVITGIGAVTPLANDIRSTWARALKAESGIERITHFDASFFPSQIAGEVRGFDFSPWVARDPGLGGTMVNARFALQASAEAVDDSGLELGRINRSRFGVYFAAGDGGANVDPLSRAFFKSFNGNVFSAAAYVREAIRGGEAVVDVEQEPQRTLHHLIRHFGMEGPASNCLTACAASAQAIGEAGEIIRRGRADVMLSGGAHSMIHPFGMAGFCLLSTLSTANEKPHEASRPFDAMRTGFVLSEGAGAIVLEEYEHAKKRGARIYGELAGYGSTADAYRLTDSHPEGLGASRAMEMALAQAGVSTADIDYMNAHGTSTKVNDVVETIAVKRVFGDLAKKLAVSSTKSMTGHLIAAAGALELQFCLLAMRDGAVPPTINYKNPDPDCDLDYIPNQARKKEVRVAMSNSFGFGGQNVVLVVRKI